MRLRKSNGDSETDLETMEAMTKWQFNPKTIPEGGRINVKVRVTFEESGSQFQRENEERRRELVEQKFAVPEQQRQTDRVKSVPTVVNIQEIIPEPVAPKTAIIESPPAPVYVPPVYVVPELVYVTPAPVYDPPLEPRLPLENL
jgi:hypothetical protein